VVHRDLKPGNVILEGATANDADLSGVCVRVLDFGMAKLIHGSSSVSMTALTEQNMVFGTPEYMAPEQARGDDVDARSDIYSAGVLLYELLSGRLPFFGNTPIGIMTAHLTEEPLPPSSQAPHRSIPPALESVVLHAMAKQPDRRYPSARHLREALCAAMANPADTLSIAPPGPDDPALSDTQHDMNLPAGLSRTEVDVAAVTLDMQPAQAGGSKLWLLIAIVAALLGIAAGVAVSLGTR
jgi:serine/threonine-protein kinase